MALLEGLWIRHHYNGLGGEERKPEGNLLESWGGRQERGEALGEVVGRNLF